MVMAPDHENYVRLSIGSFGNRKHSLLLVQGADVEQRRQPFKGKVESDVWQQVKIEISKGQIRCFLNDEIIHDEPLEGDPVAGSIGLGSWLVAAGYYVVVRVRWWMERRVRRCVAALVG